MFQNKHYYFWLTTVFILLTCFAASVFGILESGDETRVAGITAEMYFTGDYLIPKLNGKAFLEYPPLYYWFQLLCVKVFGLKEFTMGLASSFSAAASTFILYLFCIKLKKKSAVAFFCVFIFLTSSQVFEYTHKCIVDMQLAFFILLSIFGFYFRKENFVYLLIFIAGLAGGLMTKGLIGLAIPGVISICCLVWENAQEKRFDFLQWLKLALCALAAWLPWIGWTYLIWEKKGYQAFYEAVWVQNFGRFLGTQGDHTEPFWYYLSRIPELFQPWTIFLLISLVVSIRKQKKKQTKEDIFLLIAIVGSFIVFTIASAKRQLYLLPLASAAAMQTAFFFQSIWEKHPDKMQKFCKGFLRFSAAFAVIAGIILIFWSQPILLFYIIPLILCGALSFFMRNETKRLSLIVCMFAFLCCIIFALLEKNAAEKESLRPLFEQVSHFEKNGKKVILVSFDERTLGAAFFYLGHPLSIGWDRNAVMIMRDRYLWNKYKAAGHPVYADYHFLLLPEDSETFSD